MSNKKKTKLWKNKDYKQSILTAKLHDKMRNYFKHVCLKKLGKKWRAGVTMSGLVKRQSVINKFREDIGKKPFTYVEDLKERIKNLES